LEFAARCGDQARLLVVESLWSFRHLVPGADQVRIERRPARPVNRLVFFAFSHVLTVRTPIGCKLRPRALAHSGPLIRVKSADLAAAGVERVPRTVGVRDGLPELADGRTPQVANVVWCTGFRPDTLACPVPGPVGRGWVSPGVRSLPVVVSVRAGR
jgi:hypothetical protein